MAGDAMMTVPFALKVRRGMGDPVTLSVSLMTGGASWGTDGPTESDNGLLLSSRVPEAEMGIATFQLTPQTIEIWLARIAAHPSGFTAELWLTLPVGTTSVQGIARIPNNLTVLASLDNQPQTLISQNWTLPLRS